MSQIEHLLGNSYINTSDNGTIISRDMADANASLIVDLVNASSTGMIESWRFGGTQKAYTNRYGEIAAVKFYDIDNTHIT